MDVYVCGIRATLRKRENRKVGIDYKGAYEAFDGIDEMNRQADRHIRTFCLEKTAPKKSHGHVKQITKDVYERWNGMRLLLT